MRTFSLLFVLLLGLYSNSYSQVWKLYSGEHELSELAAISIDKDKKDPIIIYSVNDSSGRRYHETGFMKFNGEDNSFACTILPGKCTIEVGCDNIKRRFLTFEVLAQKVYKLKKQRDEIVIYEGKKQNVPIIVKLPQKYTEQVCANTSSPARLSTYHQVKTNVNGAHLDVNLLKIDSCVGISGGNAYGVYVIRKGKPDNYLQLLPGSHTLEFSVVGWFTKSDGVIFSYPEKVLKITRNFEEGKKYVITGDAILYDLYTQTPFSYSIKIEEIAQ